MPEIDVGSFDNCYCTSEADILEGYVAVDSFQTLSNLIGEYQCVIFTASWIMSHASLLHSRSVFDDTHNTQHSLFWSDSLTFLQLCYGAITYDVNRIPGLDYKILAAKTEMDLLLQSATKFLTQAGFKLAHYKDKQHIDDMRKVLAGCQDYFLQVSGNVMPVLFIDGEIAHVTPITAHGQFRGYVDDGYPGLVPFEQAISRFSKLITTGPFQGYNIRDDLHRFARVTCTIFGDRDHVTNMLALARSCSILISMPNPDDDTQVFMFDFVNYSVPDCVSAWCFITPRSTLVMQLKSGDIEIAIDQQLTDKTISYLDARFKVQRFEVDYIGEEAKQNANIPVRAVENTNSRQILDLFGDEDRKDDPIPLSASQQPQANFNSTNTPKIENTSSQSTQLLTTDKQALDKLVPPNQLATTVQRLQAVEKTMQLGNQQQPVPQPANNQPQPAQNLQREENKQEIAIPQPQVQLANANPQFPQGQLIVQAIPVNGVDPQQLLQANIQHQAFNANANQQPANPNLNPVLANPVDPIRANGIQYRQSNSARRRVAIAYVLAISISSILFDMPWYHSTLAILISIGLQWIVHHFVYTNFRRFRWYFALLTLVATSVSQLFPELMFVVLTGVVFHILGIYYGYDYQRPNRQPENFRYLGVDLHNPNAPNCRFRDPTVWRGFRPPGADVQVVQQLMTQSCASSRMPDAAQVALDNVYSRGQYWRLLLHEAFHARGLSCNLLVGSNCACGNINPALNYNAQGPQMAFATDLEQGGTINSFIQIGMRPHTDLSLVLDPIDNDIDHLLIRRASEHQYQFPFIFTRVLRVNDINSYDYVKIADGLYFIFGVNPGTRSVISIEQLIGVQPSEVSLTVNEQYALNAFTIHMKNQSPYAILEDLVITPPHLLPAVLPELWRYVVSHTSASPNYRRFRSYAFYTLQANNSMITRQARSIAMVMKHYFTCKLLMFMVIADYIMCSTGLLTQTIFRFTSSRATSYVIQRLVKAQRSVDPLFPSKQSVLSILRSFNFTFMGPSELKYALKQAKTIAVREFHRRWWIRGGLILFVILVILSRRTIVVERTEEVYTRGFVLECTYANTDPVSYIHFLDNTCPAFRRCFLNRFESERFAEYFVTQQNNHTSFKFMSVHASDFTPRHTFTVCASIDPAGHRVVTLFNGTSTCSKSITDGYVSSELESVCVEDSFFTGQILNSPWAQFMATQRDVFKLQDGLCYTGGLQIRLSSQLKHHMAGLVKLFHQRIQRDQNSHLALAYTYIIRFISDGVFDRPNPTQRGTKQKVPRHDPQIYTQPPPKLPGVNTTSLLCINVYWPLAIMIRGTNSSQIDAQDFADHHPGATCLEREWLHGSFRMQTDLVILTDETRPLFEHALRSLRRAFYQIIKAGPYDQHYVEFLNQLEELASRL